MALSIEFHSSYKPMRSLLSENDVRDILEMFFRSPSGMFRIVGSLPKVRPTVRGQHTYYPSSELHEIYLSRNVIERAFSQQSAMGGNFKLPTLRMAAVCVLVHEIQHANQAVVHGGKSTINRRVPFRRYMTRPCEMDARSFVDEHMEEIAAFCDYDLSQFKPERGEHEEGEISQEIQEIFDVLSLCEEGVSIRDLTEELRSSGINTPGNIRTLQNLLEDQGITVVG